MRVFPFAVVVALLLLGARAHADELYTLTLHIAANPFAGVPAEAGVYSFVEPGILTFNARVYPPALSVSGDPINYVDVNPLNQECGPNGDPSNPPDTGNDDTCVYLNQPDHDYVFQSYGGPLTAEGFYSGSAIDLSISRVPSSVTPEPPGFLLLWTGVLGGAALMRRYCA